MKSSLRVLAVMASTLLVLMFLSAPALAERKPRPDPSPSPSQSPSADLSMSIAESADPVRRGHELTYVVSIYNAGPLASSGEVDMTLQGATKLLVTPSQGKCHSYAGGGEQCGLGTIAKGATATVRVTTSALAPEGASLGGRLICCTGPTDPNLENNQDFESTRVISGDGGCSSIVFSSSSCKFISAGGPITVTGAFVSEPFYPQCSFGYCPIIGYGEFSRIVVELRDADGRLLVTCSGGACSSSETVSPGRVMTCTASVTNYQISIRVIGTYACTG